MTKVNKNEESEKIIRLNANNSDELKKYFEAVFRLSKSGEEFPVDLDEVYPLVYANKKHAVNELKNTKNEDGTFRYIEGVDYQAIPHLVKAGAGTSKRIQYKLTTSCMEWFVARKVRSVFDIYRTVTHKTFDAFTNYTNIADHQKKEVQKQNSKDVNAYNYFQGNGVEDVIEYNRKNCMEHTGKRPAEWKKIGKEAGLKSKDCSSGKEVLRHLQPESACGMSFVDNMVKMGAPVDKAIELSKKYAVHLFKGMLDLGQTPNELNQ